MTADWMTVTCDKKLVVESGESLAGPRTAYARRGGRIRYSDEIVVTGKNYRESQIILGKMIKRKELPEGAVFSTAADECALDRECLRNKIWPINEEYNRYAREGKCLVTATALRVPSDRWLGGKQDKDGTYPRLVVEYGKVVGETRAAPGGWLVVTEFDVFGIPVRVVDIDYPHYDSYIHWDINPEPKKDRKTGKYDVVVGRMGDWRLVERCLGVVADYGRWVAYSDFGFRPVVRGPGFKVRKIQTSDK